MFAFDPKRTSLAPSLRRGRLILVINASTAYLEAVQEPTLEQLAGEPPPQ